MSTSLISRIAAGWRQLPPKTRSLVNYGAVAGVSLALGSTLRAENPTVIGQQNNVFHYYGGNEVQSSKSTGSDDRDKKWPDGTGVGPPPGQLYRYKDFGVVPLVKLCFPG
ncbi:hypothetical protein ACHAQE_009148 [Botrytis cinerea]